MLGGSNPEQRICRRNERRSGHCQSENLPFSCDSICKRLRFVGVAQSGAGLVALDDMDRDRSNDAGALQEVAVGDMGQDVGAVKEHVHREVEDTNS